MTAKVLYKLCKLYTKHKEASAASLHRGGGHIASAAPHHTRNVMSCDVKLTSHGIASDIRMLSKEYDVQDGLEL